MKYLAYVGLLITIWSTHVLDSVHGLSLRSIARTVARPFRGSKASSSFQDLLLTRRTINDFESELPSNWESAIEKAVEAAIYAPNHKRTEPWRFHLLGPEAIENVCRLNADIVTKNKGEAAGAKKLDRWLAMPGWLVVTCVQSEGSDANAMQDPMGLAREDYAACCCAVQNLSLSLHSSGLGTKWTTGPVNFDEGFRGAANIPSNEYVVGTIWFGKAAKQPKSPPKRLGVNDVLVRHG